MKERPLEIRFQPGRCPTKKAQQKKTPESSGVFPLGAENILISHTVGGTVVFGNKINVFIAAAGQVDQNSVIFR